MFNETFNPLKTKLKLINVSKLSIQSQWPQMIIAKMLVWYNQIIKWLIFSTIGFYFGIGESSEMIILSILTEKNIARLKLKILIRIESF